VRFSFEAFSDSALGSVSHPYLAGRVEVIPEDSARFLIRFGEPSPDQLYDATYHVRIIPKHVWESVPRGSWAADTSTARLTGSGPFRLERWERGQFLILSADSTSDRAGIRRAIWRFTTDPDAALNLVLSHEADLLETAIGPERAQRAAADSTLRLISYPSAAYGFLGFNLYDRQRRGPHPLLASVEFPWDIKPIIRSHHERNDGNGYPDRLRGDEIPLGAQIICIVDVYDALTTTRSYRGAMSRAEALARMEVDRHWWRSDVYAAFLRSVGTVAIAA
jgi:hypothetical protein